MVKITCFHAEELTEAIFVGPSAIFTKTSKLSLHVGDLIVAQGLKLNFQKNNRK
jgi:hypothetical protein